MSAESGHTVLAIGAHPDDIEIGCGGYLAALARQGHRVVHAIVTDGAEGSQSLPRAELIVQRRDEARASAQVLGAGEVVFLGQPEAAAFTPDFKPALISLIRRVKPRLVLTHATSETMGDHRRVSEAVRDAVGLAGGPWYRECGPPHGVDALYGFEVWAPLAAPGLSVNISDELEIKLRALACHRSQLRDIDYLEAVAGLAKYRGVMLRNGGAAEAFEVIRTVDEFGRNR